MSRDFPLLSQVNLNSFDYKIIVTKIFKNHYIIVTLIIINKPFYFFYIYNLQLMEEGQHVELNYREIDALQREFQQILVELAGDQSLVRFKHEYDRLYRALRRSHDNQRILYNKITQLSRDIANQTAKLRLALKMSQEDAQAIAYLKQQLQKTFKVLELSKEREERAKQKIEGMNSKIGILQSNLQQFQAKSAGQSNAINDLKEKREQLTRQKDELNESLTKVKGQLSENYQKLRVSETEKGNTQGTLKSLEKDILQIQEKLKKDEGRKAKIQEQLDNLAKQRDTAVAEVNKFNQEQTALNLAIKQKQGEIQSANAQLQELRNQTQIKQQDIRKLKEQFIHKTTLKGQLNRQNIKIQKEIQTLNKQYNATISETASHEKIIEKLGTDLRKGQELLETALKNNKMVERREEQLKREILDRKKLNYHQREEVEDLQKERGNLLRQLTGLERQFKSYNQKLAKKEKEIFSYEEKISQGNQTIQGLEKTIIQIQKEKEMYGKKAALANTKYQQSLEQIKLKGNLISQYQKKNIQTENRLKQQQELYESVRSARNTYSKNLSETEDEIAETKRRYKIVNHQINQLKEQIQAKEVALAKEHFQHKKKDQSLLQYSRQLEKKKKQMDTKREIIKNFSNEISKLHSSIKQLQTQRQHKKDEYELILAQRDILGTQLIRRNDESALLYEKIKIQQTTLARGQTAFRQRMADLSLLQYKKGDLKRELKILMKESSKISLFKTQIFNQQSQLIQEKLKVKALSQQLQNPLNVHRCRNLEGTDPDVYEMKQKIKTLQKRLIYKTQQVVEKEVLVHQKQKQIEQIREIMKRQPGLQVAERLSIMQKTLDSKTRKMKEFAGEINMYQAKSNQFKYDIQRTQKQIQEIKRKYNEQKKREQISQQNQKILQQG